MTGGCMTGGDHNPEDKSPWKRKLECCMISYAIVVANATLIKHQRPWTRDWMNTGNISCLWTQSQHGLGKYQGHRPGVSGRLKKNQSGRSHQTPGNFKVQLKSHLIIPLFSQNWCQYVFKCIVNSFVFLREEKRCLGKYQKCFFLSQPAGCWGGVG